MGLFTKLFKNEQQSDNPDNAHLLELLDIYQKKNGQNSYEDVLNELLNGNSFLMFPTQNDKNSIIDQWKTATTNTKLKIRSVVNIDGLKVFGVFTDEESMLSWTKSKSEYTALRAQDVLKMCQDNNFDRLVINTGLPNMYVLERNRENIQSHTIMEDTPVQIGTPNNPLPANIVNKLIENFKKVTTITEAYQYGQLNEKEFSIVIGIKLSVNSDNARNASINAIQNALMNETVAQNLDIFFIETDDWYNSIKKVNNSLVYKKQDAL